jgi:chromate transporter
VRDNIYIQLIAVFAPLSLLSLGGGQSIVADINQQAVAIHGWVTQAEFVDLFAISRAFLDTRVRGDGRVDAA